MNERGRAPGRVLSHRTSALPWPAPTPTAAAAPVGLPVTSYLRITTAHPMFDIENELRGVLVVIDGWDMGRQPYGTSLVPVAPGRHRPAQCVERWRAASNDSTAAAMATLRLSARPACGIVTTRAIGTSSGTPCASLPSTSASGARSAPGSV